MPAENIETLVIDASFLLAYLLPDENLAQVNQAILDYKQGKIKLLTSPILSFEVLNGLKYACVSKRITSQISTKLIKGFMLLEVPEEEIDFEKVFNIALKNDLSVYDASYLLISKSNNIKLLTLDKKLESITHQTRV